MKRIGFILPLLISSLLLTPGCSQKKLASKKELEWNQTSYNLGLPLRWHDDGDGQIEEPELSGFNAISPKAGFEAGEPNPFLQKLIEKIDWNTVNLQKLSSLLQDTEFLNRRLESSKNRQAYRRALRNRELARRRLKIINIDFSSLPKSDQGAIKTLIDEVIPYVEAIYLTQMDPKNLIYREEIIENGDPEDLFAFYHLGGVRCLTGGTNPLCSTHPDSPPPTPNQGFWPPDYDKGESIKPEALRSPFVTRSRLSTGEWSWGSINNYPPIRPQQERLIAGLKKMSRITGLDPSIIHFLVTRAEELGQTSNPYPFFDGDIEWTQLNGPWDMTLGYYEVYHSPFHLNAIMEAFVGIVDREQEEKGLQFRKLLYWMEDEIAKDLGPQYQKRDFKTLPPLKFIEAFSVGDSRAKSIALAYYLPNVKPYGRDDLAKKVILTNNIAARYEAVTLPMAEVVMDPNQVARLNTDDISLFVIGHENAHGAGPAQNYVVRRKNEKITTSHELMKQHSSALEEARADVLGLASLPEAVRREIITQEQANNAAIGLLALLTRGLAMGEEDDHAKAATLIFYALIQNGGIIETPEGRFAINLEGGKVFAAAQKISNQLNRIQMTGNFRAYDRWYRDAITKMPSRMKDHFLPILREMPKDFFPYYRFKFSLDL